MCFGGGAPEYEKPDFGPLPSLRMAAGSEASKQTLEDVPVARRGQPRRSLFMPVDKAMTNG
jgi:hypothetical protein